MSLFDKYLKLKKYKKENAVLLDKYLKYRKCGMKLNEKIVKFWVNQEILIHSAKLLGIFKKNQLILEYEGETSVVMDFAINDYRVKGKTGIEAYKSSKVPANQTEEELLEGLMAANTSLFRVEDISRRNHLITLSDVMAEQEEIRIIDRGFGQTGIRGMLIFFRLISLPELNMTSGVPFAFPPNSEEKLLKKWRSMRNKVKSADERIKRFVTFFKLSKREGLTMEYK